jgi:hypothetical protein
MSSRNDTRLDPPSWITGLTGLAGVPTGPVLLEIERLVVERRVVGVIPWARVDQGASGVAAQSPGAIRRRSGVHHACD